jgi:hypothetical protein
MSEGGKSEPFGFVHVRFVVVLACAKTVEPRLGVAVEEETRESVSTRVVSVESAATSSTKPV